VLLLDLGDGQGIVVPEEARTWSRARRRQEAVACLRIKKIAERKIAEGAPLATGGSDEQ
jgi:hypothetical protein